MSTNENDRSAAALGGHTPTAQIHQAHRAALRARQNYVSVAMSNAGEDMLQHAHHQLNRSVLRYLEAMKYLLRTKDALSNYWDGKAPKKPGVPFDDGDAFLYVTEHRDTVPTEWATAAKKAIKAARPQGYKPTMDDLIEQYREERDLKPADRVQFSLSPRDGIAYAVALRIPHYGLRRVENQWQHRRTVQQRTTGMLGTRTTEHERPDYLPAEVLIRAGTALDEAADQLSLLAEVDQSVPRTDISEDMLDDVREWHRQNFAEAEDA